MIDTAVQRYELMVIFFPDIGESAIGKELEELKKYISSNGGEVIVEDAWGVRDMAYSIKKQVQGFYYVLNFTLEAAKVGEMQRGLVINPAVIRALIVKTPEKYLFRTFAEYQQEEEKARAEKEEAKQKKEAKRTEQSGSKSAKKHKVEGAAPNQHDKEQKKIEKSEKPEKSERSEKLEETVDAPKKAKKTAPAKINLEEVDAKLKSIIDDPDISL